jgi:hypothetical protein
MMHSDAGAPAWLFSFVDLAFLMVIAMSQLAPDPGAKFPDLGEMLVPRVGAAAATEMGAGAAEIWQLRVHPPKPESTSPFELVQVKAATPGNEGRRIETPGLRVALASLKSERAMKPMLVPHADSRSQDMLEAAALLEEVWPGRRRAAVSRVFDRR